MINLIEIHKSVVSNNIIKAFAVGTIRNWGGIDYKKISDDEWVKINNGKTKKTSLSSVVKNLENEAKELAVNINSIKKEYRNFLINEFEKDNKNLRPNSIIFNVMVERYIQDSISNNDNYANEINEIRAKRNVIVDEIRELNKKIYLLKKENREKKTGLKQIDLNDLNNLLESNLPHWPFFSLIKDKKRIIESIPVSEYYKNKEVNSNDYYICTDATFDVLSQGDKAESLFEKMKSSGKFQYTHSPKSTSEYLVDSNNGVVYRISDHWGRCASCVWELNQTIEWRKYTLAKCNISDFKRNNSFLGAPIINPEFERELINRVKKEILQMNNVLQMKAEFDKSAKKLLVDKFNNLNNVVHKKLLDNYEVVEMFKSLTEIYNKMP